MRRVSDALFVATCHVSRLAEGSGGGSDLPQQALRAEGHRDLGRARARERGDHSHAEELVVEMSCDGVRGRREAGEEDLCRDGHRRGAQRFGQTVSPGGRAARFRELAATSNYFAAPRSTSKSSISAARCPRRRRAQVKRLARYPVEFPRLIWGFSRETKGEERVLHVFADSDRASCPRTRRSISRGVIVVSVAATKE